MHTHTLGQILFPATHLCQRLETLMSQVDDLRNAIAQLGTDLGEATDRIEASLADANVDLTPELEQLRSFSNQLDSLAVTATDETPPEGEEPPPEGETPPGEEPSVP